MDTPVAASAKSGVVRPWVYSMTKSPNSTASSWITASGTTIFRAALMAPSVFWVVPATTRNYGVWPIHFPIPSRAKPCASPALRPPGFPSLTNCPSSCGEQRRTTSSFRWKPCPISRVKNRICRARPWPMIPAWHSFAVSTALSNPVTMRSVVISVIRSTTSATLPPSRPWASIVAT